jgi:translation elongation factor EF-1beta
LARLSRLQDLLQERLSRLDSLYERIDLYDVRETDASVVAAAGSSAGTRTAGSQRYVTYNISGPVAQMNVGDRQMVENIQSHLAGMDAQGQQQVAIGLKAISEAAVSDPELNAETRAEVLEAIEDVSEAAAALPAARRQGRVKRALEFPATTANAATALGRAWDQWRPVIEQHLSRG